MRVGVRWSQKNRKNTATGRRQKQSQFIMNHIGSHAAARDAGAPLQLRVLMLRRGDNSSHIWSLQCRGRFSFISWKAMHRSFLLLTLFFRWKTKLTFCVSECHRTSDNFIHAQLLVYVHYFFSARILFSMCKDWFGVNYSKEYFCFRWTNQYSSWWWI